MQEFMMPEEAEREKRGAAFASILAAVLLTTLKLIVGLITNSLGMLSEALHSGFDLLAAGLTYFAVRFASLPPDPGHPYGHGKMENLSALIESLLLFLTCGWIVWEAVDRLFFNPEPVTPSLWAVGVMLISIIVDFNRARMLKRMAEKHRSQALEADALHFSTDILSSAVVLVGLGALYIAAALPDDSALRPWLEKADSLAALGVSAIVLKVSYSLAKRAVNVLLDGGDAGLTSAIHEALEGMPSVKHVYGVRLRHSGPDLFVDAAIGVDGALVLAETRQLRKDVESAIRKVAEHAKVSIELIPDEPSYDDRIGRVREMAVAEGLKAHAIDLLEFENLPGAQRRLLLEMHVEVEAGMALGPAHAQVSLFEKRMGEAYPDTLVVTHLEPAAREDEAVKTILLDAGFMQSVAQQLVMKEEKVTDCHNVLFRACGESLYVSFHCRMHPDTPVEEAHKAASRLQAALHKRMPELARVMVHMEPFKK